MNLLTVVCSEVVGVWKSTDAKTRIGPACVDVNGRVIPAFVSDTVPVPFWDRHREALPDPKRALIGVVVAKAATGAPVAGPLPHGIPMSKIAAAADVELAQSKSMLTSSTFRLEPRGFMRGRDVILALQMAVVV